MAHKTHAARHRTPPEPDDPPKTRLRAHLSDEDAATTKAPTKGPTVPPGSTTTAEP